MTALLGDLVVALDALNPDAVEPMMERLAAYLPKARLLPIQRGIDAFDFVLAQERAEELGAKMGLIAG